MERKPGREIDDTNQSSLPLSICSTFYIDYGALIRSTKSFDFVSLTFERSKTIGMEASDVQSLLMKKALN